MDEEKIRLVDIPLIITFGDICRNVSDAHKIMVAITESRYDDAFDIAREIFERNDKIHDEQIDREAVEEILKIGRLKSN